MTGAGRFTMLVLLVCLGHVSWTAATGEQTVVFQEGLGGYAGTVDLHLSIPANFTGTGHKESEFVTDANYQRWEWDGEDTHGYGTIVTRSRVNRLGLGDNLGLLRFGGIFGDGPGQIPPGAEIVSATLVLQAAGPAPGDPANLHRVLIPWDDGVDWESFGAEPGPNSGTDFAGALETTTGPGLGTMTIDVTSSLRSWSAGPSTNHGWIFIPVAAAQDIITVQGSGLGEVTGVTVSLSIQTPQRGEIVATLAHGGYTAVLLDRVGAATCDALDGSTADNLDIVLDDAAATDVHDSGGSGMLTGTWQPDGSCFPRALCTGGGTGGLCGQPADGAWILNVADEWLAGGTDAVVLSWGITLRDGTGGSETYTSSPGLPVPKRHFGDGEGLGGKTTLWSSEAPDAALRPRLEVTFRTGSPVIPMSSGGRQEGTNRPGAALPVGEPAAAAGEAVEYDLHIEPYVQPGNTLLNTVRDQFVVSWQTLTRTRGGPLDDAFEFAYRMAGDEAWTPVPVPPPIPAGSASRLNHAVTVSDLPFGAEFEYRVVHLRNGVPRPGGTFQSVVRTQPGGAFRFTAFGNSGTGSGVQETTARLPVMLDTHLHLLLGDYVYYYGEREHYKPKINFIYSDLMRSTFVLPVLGNHDGLTELGRPTIDHFHLPENGPAALPLELNYSFDYGNVHFAGINSGRDLADLAAHVGPWLRADLAASDKTWKVVFTHEPPVTRDPYRIDRQENAAVRDAILKVAVEEGAQLFLAGAVHSMQRYLPITAVIPAEGWVEWAPCASGEGTTLIYAGTATSPRLPPGPIPSTLEPPMVVYAPQTGIALFDVRHDTLTVSLVDVNGSAFDTVTLASDPPDCRNEEAAAVPLLGPSALALLVILLGLTGTIVLRRAATARPPGGPVQGR